MTGRGHCLAGLALLALGCDAAYGGFLGAIPMPAYDETGPVEVVLAVDGLSREAFDRARAAGAFGSFSDGDLITPFPGTSDYAWTRTLGTGSLPGYEMQYYDPGRNRLEKAGLGGVIEHPIREGLAGSLPCYQRFDFLGDGYLWMARGYQDPEAALPGTLDELFAVLVRRSRQQSRFLAYLLNVDVIGHKGGQDKAVAALVEIDRRIQRFRQAHGERFRFTLLGRPRQRACSGAVDRSPPGHATGGGGTGGAAAGRAGGLAGGGAGGARAGDLRGPAHPAGPGGGGGGAAGDPAGGGPGGRRSGARSRWTASRCAASACSAPARRSASPAWPTAASWSTSRGAGRRWA